jgi:hypothetical protein
MERFWRKRSLRNLLFAESTSSASLAVRVGRRRIGGRPVLLTLCVRAEEIEPVCACLTTAVCAAIDHA